MTVDDGGAGAYPVVRPLSFQELLTQPDRNTYFECPREAALRKRRERWANNKERLKEERRRYRAAHKAQIKEYNFRYRQRIKEEHPLVHREHILSWQDFRRRTRTREKAERIAAEARRISSNRQVALAASQSVKSQAALREADFYQRIVDCVPRGMPRDRRDDVISEITVAFLSGEVGLDEIGKQTGLCVRRHLREIKYGQLSLDDSLREDGHLLCDTISRGLWD